MPGVKISPRQGIIKARSTFDLDVEFQIPVIIDFEFDIKIRTQTGNIFSLKVFGSVVSPAVSNMNWGPILELVFLDLLNLRKGSIVLEEINC